MPLKMLNPSRLTAFALPGLLWLDRGQPETQTTPPNKAARMYRVKKV